MKNNNNYSRLLFGILHGRKYRVVTTVQQKAYIAGVAGVERHCKI